MTVGINAFLLVAGWLFAIGLLGVLLRKNTLVIYMSLELMLNAVNLALVAFPATITRWTAICSSFSSLP